MVTTIVTQCFVCGFLKWGEGGEGEGSGCFLLLIHMSIMDLCTADQPSVLRGKNFNVGYFTKTFQPNVFIPAMLIGTIALIMNNNNNERISRAPFHVKHAQLRCTGANTKLQNK